MIMLKKSNLINLSLLTLSLLFSFTVVEMEYRFLIFNSHPTFKSFKNPDHFADYFFRRRILEIVLFL